jgi:lipid-A-disaccharide synthase
MNSILIITGENSGEKYGANLVHQFKKRQPSYTFFGIGGKHMAAEGVRLLFSIEDLALVGAFEILTHLPRLKRIFHSVKKEIIKQKPSAAVLIDSPDFNLRLARILKKLNIPVLYYISPTVWAWRRARLKSIKKFVDKMLLIFPFEKKIYQEHGIPASYVGHPLKERLKTELVENEFFKKYDLDERKILISVLPGSRRSELKFHIPVLVKAIQKIEKEFDAQFLLLLAENLSEDFVASLITSRLTALNILKQDCYEAMAFSDLVLSSCGTANLEAALLKTPVIAFYRISPLTYFLGVRLMKIKNYSIVNILAREKIIPELIQKNFTAENIFKETKRILDSSSMQKKMVEEFQDVNTLLGEKMASQNAAQELDKILKERS